MEALKGLNVDEKVSYMNSNDSCARARAASPSAASTSSGGGGGFRGRKGRGGGGGGGVVKKGGVPPPPSAPPRGPPGQQDVPRGPWPPEENCMVRVLGTILHNPPTGPVKVAVHAPGWAPPEYRRYPEEAFYYPENKMNKAWVRKRAMCGLFLPWPSWLGFRLGDQRCCLA